jgi:cell division protein FtsZ
VALTALLSVSCNAFVIQQASHTASSPLFANVNDKHHENEDMKFTTAVANGYSPPRDMKNVQFAGIRRINSSRISSSTQLGMAADRNALIPDGGLSPCVIKVVGVGGGGCNAVSNSLIHLK